MFLVARSNILAHENDIADLSSIDLCFRPSIHLIQQRSFVRRKHLHVLDKIGPDLMTIVTTELSESDWVADTGFECFVYAVNQVCGKDQNPLVIFQFSEKDLFMSALVQ